MNMNFKKRARIMVGVLAASVACASLGAIQFTFTQGGFSEGAFVTGSFSGSDDDLDGYLNYDLFGGSFELSDFSLSFSGNSSVSAFTMGLGDLQGLAFKLGGDDIIGNDYMYNSPFLAEGIIAENADYIVTVGDVLSYTGNPIIESATTYDLLDESLANPVAQQVPDSGSLATLFGAAVFGLFASRRRVAVEA